MIYAEPMFWISYSPLPVEAGPLLGCWKHGCYEEKLGIICGRNLRML